MSDHQPVLLHETLEALAVRPNGCYVDATFGRGGHATAILERLSDDGSLLVADRDPAAIETAHARVGADPRVTIHQTDFARLASVVSAQGIAGRVDGLLLDLGVSSPQLDDASRGFSFRHDGPLDMRMDPQQGESAAQWLSRASEQEIAGVIRRFGEQRHSLRIARAIIKARSQGALSSTGQLAEIVSAAVPARERKHHPATRVFQAIRIRINDELGQLENVLDSCLPLFARGGKLCVISFHSLEDRIVKRFMRRHSLEDPVWRGMPDVPPEAQPRLARPARAVHASVAEVSANPRSRSAVLRSVEVLR